MGHIALRRVAGCNAASKQAQSPRLLLSGAKRVSSSHSIAINVGPIERGDIDRGTNVVGEYPAQGVGKRDEFARHRPQAESRMEAALCFVAIDDVEELVLGRHEARKRS